MPASPTHRSAAASVPGRSSGSVTARSASRWTMAGRILARPNVPRPRLKRMPRVSLVLLLVSVAGSRGSAQQRLELIDPGRLPRFDVASVKRGDPTVPGKLDVTPGRLALE